MYVPGYYVGKKAVIPWLEDNLPSVLQFFQSQDFKIIFFFRWVPIFPFDIMSFIFGIGNFRLTHVIAFFNVRHYP